MSEMNLDAHGKIQEILSRYRRKHVSLVTQVT